jgi:hypothetical protein
MFVLAIFSIHVIFKEGNYLIGCHDFGMSSTTRLHLLLLEEWNTSSQLCIACTMVLRIEWRPIDWDLYWSTKENSTQDDTQHFYWVAVKEVPSKFRISPIINEHKKTLVQRYSDLKFNDERCR